MTEYNSEELEKSNTFVSNEIKNNQMKNLIMEPLKNALYDYFDIMKLEYTNLTTTFTGIGYIALDVNSIIETSLEIYKIDLKNLPTETIFSHFQYILNNLKQTSLKDIICLYEYTNCSYKNYIIDVLNDGSFMYYTEFNRILKEDRISICLSSFNRREFNKFCLTSGSYIGFLDYLVFEIPHTYCYVIRPYSKINLEIEYTTYNISSNCSTSINIEDFLEIKGFTIEKINKEFFLAENFEYLPLNEVIDESVVESLIEYNKLNDNKIYFDGRIYHKKRNIVHNEDNIDHSIFNIKENKFEWTEKDLELLKPAKSEKFSIKHMANIRRSAMSMYDGKFQYSTIVREKSEENKKVSKKMQKIIEENELRMKKEKEKNDNIWLRNFFNNYSKLPSLKNKKVFIESVKIDNDYINNKLNLLKIELYMEF